MDFEFRANRLGGGPGSEIKQETGLGRAEDGDQVHAEQERADYRYPGSLIPVSRCGRVLRIRSSGDAVAEGGQGRPAGLGLSVADASILSDDLGLFEYYTECVSAGRTCRPQLDRGRPPLLKEMKRDWDACR